MTDLPPPYSPSASPSLPAAHDDDRAVRLNRRLLEEINPYTSVGSATGHRLESSTFAMVRERESRARERERLAYFAQLHDSVMVEVAPPPSYPGPSSSTPSTPIVHSQSLHSQIDIYGAMLGTSSNSADNSRRAPIQITPADRERARLQRLLDRSTRPTSAPVYSPAPPPPPFQLPRQPARHELVDPYELPLLQRTTFGPIRGITPQQREQERLERLRLRDATRQVARAMTASLDDSPTRRPTPHHDAVDPYVLAEAIEASLRERQRVLDRLHAISPQQREQERLERIRSRDAARASNGARGVNRMRSIATSSCESLAGSASRRMGGGRMSAV